MAIITVERARAHCKADTDDDALLQVYLEAAERSAVMYLSRNLYADADALDEARATVPQQSYTLQQAFYAAEAAAKTIYDDAVTAAESLPEPDRTLEILAAQTRFTNATLAAADTYKRGVANLDNTLFGIVMTDDIAAAILLNVGHLFRNREAVATGNNTPGVELPMTTKELLNPHVRYGAL